MRVVIDTNVWISYLLGGLLQSIDEKILSKKVRLVVSEEMLMELSEVSNRPKFRVVFTQDKDKRTFFSS